MSFLKKIFSSSDERDSEQKEKGTFKNKSDDFLRDKSSPANIKFNLDVLKVEKIEEITISKPFLAFYEYVKRKLEQKDYAEAKKQVEQQLSDDTVFVITAMKFSELPPDDYPTEILLKVIEFKARIKQLTISTSNFKDIIKEDRDARIKLRVVEDEILHVFNNAKPDKSKTMQLVKLFEEKEGEAWESMMFLMNELIQKLELDVT